MFKRSCEAFASPLVSDSWVVRNSSVVYLVSDPEDWGLDFWESQDMYILFINTMNTEN